MSKKRPISVCVDWASDDSPPISSGSSSGGGRSGGGSSSSGGGSVGGSSSYGSITTAFDEDFAAWVASRCEMCEVVAANPGHPYCTGCYNQCFRGRLCSLCGVAGANPGHEWCTSCYLAQRGGGGPGASFASPPENASYEELLAWEQARGAAVFQGFSGAQLNAVPQCAPFQIARATTTPFPPPPTNPRRRVFLGDQDALKGDDALCVVCQEEYTRGDNLSTLPACAHTFHTECLERWLKDKPSCPVCMRDCRQDMQ